MILATTIKYQEIDHEPKNELDNELDIFVSQQMSRYFAIGKRETNYFKDLSPLQLRLNEYYDQVLKTSISKTVSVTLFLERSGQFNREVQQ